MNKIFTDLSNNSLKISIIVVSLLFLIFYPSKYLNIDEHDYLNNAQLILNNNLLHNCSAEIIGQFRVQNNNCISKYNLGTSLFYIPTMFFSGKIVYPKLAFLTTFIIYLTGIFIFSLLLKKYKITPFLLYFYAFFPPFLYYSRTLFSEIYSVTFILISFFLLIKLIESNKKMYGLTAGLCIGLSIFIRYTNVIPLAILTLGLFSESIRNSIISKEYIKKIFFQILSITISLLPIIFIILLINKNLYGSYFRSGYFYSGEEGIKITNQFDIIFIKYFIITNLIYPLMLVFSFFVKLKYKWIFLVTTLTEVLFYSLVKNITFTGRISDVIFSYRLILPVIPFLLLIYLKGLNFLKNSIKGRIFLMFLFLSLFISSIIINILHTNFLLSR